MQTLLLVQNQLLLDHFWQIFIVIALDHPLHIIWNFLLFWAYVILMAFLNCLGILLLLVHLLILESFLHLVRLLLSHLHLLVDLFILVDDLMSLSSCIVKILLVIVYHLHLLILWLLILLLYFLKELWITVFLKLIRKLTLHFSLILRCQLRKLRVLLSWNTLSHVCWLILINLEFRILNMGCLHLLLHHFNLLVIEKLVRRHEHLVHDHLLLLVPLVHLLLHHHIIFIHILSVSVPNILLRLHAQYLLIR